MAKPIVSTGSAGWWSIDLVLCRVTVVILVYKSLWILHEACEHECAKGRSDVIGGGKTWLSLQG